MAYISLLHSGKDHFQVRISIFLCFRHHGFCLPCPWQLTSESIFRPRIKHSFPCLLWRVFLGIVADSLLLRSMSSTVFCLAPVPTSLFPLSVSAQGLAGALGGFCSLKDLLIPAFKGFEPCLDKHQRQDVGCFIYLFFSFTAVSLIRCSQGFREAYKMCVCFQRQRL